MFGFSLVKHVCYTIIKVKLMQSNKLYLANPFK